MRQRECKEEESRDSAHRREVAGRTNQRLVADGIGWVGAGQEMDSLEKRIAAQNPVAVAAGSDNRRVVADSEAQFRAIFAAALEIRARAPNFSTSLSSVTNLSLSTVVARVSLQVKFLKRILSRIETRRPDLQKMEDWG